MSQAGVKATTEMPRASARRTPLTNFRSTQTRSSATAATAAIGLTLQDVVGNAAVERLLLAQRMARAEGVRSVSRQMQHRIDAQSGTGHLLDGPTRAEMESVLTVDLSGVRLHSGVPAASLSKELSARAFTQGRDVFLGPEAGADTLAHELTHASEGRTGPGNVQCDDSVAAPLLLADQPSGLGSVLEPKPPSMLLETTPLIYGPSPETPAMTLPATEPEPIFEVRVDPDGGRSVFEELSPTLPADPLADAMALRAALGDDRWQKLEAAATRRESLRRRQQMSYPEGRPMVDTTVDDVLAPATYADPGDVAQVWSNLKGDSEPSAFDQELVLTWAVATAISGYRATVANYPAIVALVDPDALEGGPSRLVLLLTNGQELPLDRGLIELNAMDELAPKSLTAWGNRTAADATTMLMAKSMIVQGTVLLKAVEELAATCEKDHANTVVASLEHAKLQTDAIVSASSKLGAAASPNLTVIKSELDAASAAATTASKRIAGVIHAVRVFQFEKMGGSGRSLDEFWRRADDVFLVGTVFSFLSAGDSRYRAQRLQAIHDGTMSYNQFDGEMNGWKEYLSAGVHMATTLTAAKLAGPGATAVFSIDATWSPYVAAATRNVFASFATSIGNNVAVSIAVATSSPDNRTFLESFRVTLAEAVMGAGLGMGLDWMVIRTSRPGQFGAGTSSPLVETEGAGTAATDMPSPVPQRSDGPIFEYGRTGYPPDYSAEPTAGGRVRTTERASNPLEDLVDRAQVHHELTNRSVVYDPAAEAAEGFGMHNPRMDLDVVPGIPVRRVGPDLMPRLEEPLPVDIEARSYILQRGNLFDEQAYRAADPGQYGMRAEVYVESRTGRRFRVDRYSVDEVIAEHKFTQFAEISDKYAQKYLAQLWGRYPPGAHIPNVPTTRLPVQILDATGGLVDAPALGRLAGSVLEGQQVLVIPHQVAQIPLPVLESAAGYRIRIVDIEGNVYSVEHPGPFL